MVVGEDINYPDAVVTFVRKGTILTPSIINNMRRHKIQSFILAKSIPGDKKASDKPDKVYIPTYRPAVNSSVRDSAVENLDVLFKEVSIGATDIHASTAQVIKNLDRVVDHLVDVLCVETSVDILNLKSHDDYTYHHSLTVGVVSAAIGQQMGISGEDLHCLCKCAVLHDIGKSTIPSDIINKPSKLSSEEFELMKTHTTAGYDYLAKAVNNDRVVAGALFHHEKVDGSGYPNGLDGNEIPLWSKIISVADVYDALTSNRPYRTPMQPAEAVEYLMGSIGRDFDYDVVSSFLKKVDIYPVGSLVSLSNGKEAAVYNNEQPLRPVVRVLQTGEILDLYRDRNCLNIVISGII